MLPALALRPSNAPNGEPRTEPGTHADAKRRPGLRPARSTRATSVPTSSSLGDGHHAALVDEAHHGVEPLPRLEIRKHEWPLAAHLARVAVHHLERCADQRRQVDL